MQTDERKTCPYCAEEIPAKARVCPRCRQWLTIKSAANPLVTAMVVAGVHVILFTVLACFLVRSFERLQNPPPWYQDHAGAVQILSREFHWVETKDGPRLFVTGVVTNRSDIAWCALEMECRFLDSAGRMVDAASAVARVTVGSHDDCAFRVTVEPGLPRGDYASVTLNVANARNTRAW